MTRDFICVALTTCSLLILPLAASAQNASTGAAAGGVGGASGGMTGSGGTAGTGGALNGGTYGNRNAVTTGGASIGDMGKATQSGTSSSGMAGSGSAGVSASSWDAENNYWRGQYPSRPYYSSSTTYSAYEPAYRYGVDAYSQYQGQPWDNIDQARLQAGWNSARGNSTLTWEQANQAARDAYGRMHNHSANSMGTAAPASGGAAVR